MKLTEAFEIFLRVKPVVKALAQDLKDLEAAEKVLKAHCQETEIAVYRKRVAYSAVPYQRLDTALARTALGPKKAAECTVDTLRQSLTLLPAPVRRGAVLLEVDA